MGSQSSTHIFDHTHSAMGQMQDLENISGSYAAALSRNGLSNPALTLSESEHDLPSSEKGGKADTNTETVYTISNPITMFSLSNAKKKIDISWTTKSSNDITSNGVKKGHVTTDDWKALVVKRRRSQGDKPIGLTPESHSDEQSVEERYLLGRASAIVPSHLGDELPNRVGIRLTEVAPSNGSIINDEEDAWKLPINDFSAKKHGKVKGISKRIRSYYKAQDELITNYEEIQLDVDDALEKSAKQLALRKNAEFYAKLSFVLNVCLLIAKSVAVAISGSISIISSLVDSSVDLLSGIVIWWTSRAARKRNPYFYPQGRTRLEPLGIIILSAVMSIASLQLVITAIQKIVALAGKVSELPNVDVTTIVITCSTIVTKFVLYMLCRRVNTGSVQALAQDHRNDVLSNSVAVVFGYVGSSEMFAKSGVYELCYVDPIGAIIISLYIFVSWWTTGYEQIKLLTGYTAKPHFLSKLTWMSFNHHKKIANIDTVRAFHFGTNFLVEVDIVLPEQMTLKEAHDIGESLQQKLERLTEVERAFVHLDYEFTHNPKSEHKIV